jgi:hypothetical protein
MGKDEIIKGFKGFDKNLKCRDFQYEIGKEYETDKKPVRCTENGFHFCEHPMDVFSYYPPATSRYGKVEGSGDVSRDNSDSKIAVQKIKIGAEISLHSFIEGAVKFIFSKTTLTKENTNAERQKQASNSGDKGAASNSGYKGAASNSGYYGAASNSGDNGAASNSGDNGAASNSGDNGAASNSGYKGAASNSGYNGAAFTVGNYSSSETNAKESVACGVGYRNKAKSNIGSWIVLAERNDNGEILTVKTARVDGKKIKENVWYELKNGEFITPE